MCPGRSEDESTVLSPGGQVSQLGTQPMTLDTTIQLVPLAAPQDFESNTVH